MKHTVLIILAAVVAHLALIITTSTSSPAFASGASTGGFVATQGRAFDATLSGNVSTPVTIGGLAGVPTTGVSAVAVTLTAVSPVGTGLINASSSGLAYSTPMSYLNYQAGETRSNAGTIAVGPDGKIKVMATSVVRLVIDVQGYYIAGSTSSGGYVPVAPKRIVDTRNGTGLPQTRLAAGSTTAITLAGAAGVPADATAAIVNFTVINPTSSGYLRTTPSGQTPKSPTLNFSNAATTSISATVGLASGTLDLYVSGSSANLVIDIVGYFTQSANGGDFTATSARAVDTRQAPLVAIPANATSTFTVSGVGGLPTTGVGAVSLHIGVIGDGTGGYINVWKAYDAEPATSSLQYASTGVTSAGATSGLSADGKISIHNYGSRAVHVVIDIEGWYSLSIAADPDGGSYSAFATPAVALDTTAFSANEGRTIDLSQIPGVPDFTSIDGFAARIEAKSWSSSGQVYVYAGGTYQSAYPAIAYGTPGNPTAGQSDVFLLRSSDSGSIRVKNESNNSVTLRITLTGTFAPWAEDSFDLTTAGTNYDFAISNDPDSTPFAAVSFDDLASEFLVESVSANDDSAITSYKTANRGAACTSGWRFVVKQNRGYRRAFIPRGEIFSFNNDSGQAATVTIRESETTTKKISASAGVKVGVDAAIASAEASFNISVEASTSMTTEVGVSHPVAAHRFGHFSGGSAGVFIRAHYFYLESNCRVSVDHGTIRVFFPQHGTYGYYDERAYPE